MKKLTSSISNFEKLMKEGYLGRDQPKADHGKSWVQLLFLLPEETFSSGFARTTFQPVEPHARILFLRLKK